VKAVAFEGTLVAWRFPLPSSAEAFGSACAARFDAIAVRVSCSVGLAKERDNPWVVVLFGREL